MLRRTSWLLLAVALAWPLAAAAEPASRADLFKDWRERLSRAANLDDRDAAAALYRSILDEAAPRAEEGILVARAADALADLYRKQKRFDLAAPLYERSTAMWLRLLGPNQTRMAVSLHNLGVCYVELARWEDAERRLTEAIGIWLHHGNDFWYEHSERALQAAREQRKIPWGSGVPFTERR